jgi:hypothetical protein
MPRPYASSVIDAPVQQVWERIRDFNSMPSWTGGAIAKSEIEGGGTGDQVGKVRVLELPDGTKLRETLLSLSDLERSYTYDFTEVPFPVDGYIGTLRVHPVTDGDRTFIEWYGSFDCKPEDVEPMKGLFENVVYQGAFDALKAHFSAS